MKSETAPAAGRKLNMEEKRKLEKLLLADIDNALSAYSSQRTAERETQEERAISHAPAQAKALLKEYVAALKMRERVKTSLEALGYDVQSDYQNNYGYDLKLAYEMPPKSLKDFDAQTEETESKMEALKRSYTLKLFAGGAEAQELFASLADELATITK